MIKSIFLSFVCIAQSFFAIAADELLLYHVNKQVHWMHDGKKDAAKRGVFLLPQHSLVITAQSNVMLVQKDGKSMLLDKPGTYSFSQLKILLQKIKAENVSKNFFAYVFEKFLSADGDEKQKVAAVVYRGRTAMLLPADSSFVFSIPQLTWKPEQFSIPYKIEIKVNEIVFDTTIRKQRAFKIPKRFLTNQPQLIKWSCYPADSKQKPQPFVLLLPKKEDIAIIQQQLEALRKACGTNAEMREDMERDLLEQWLEHYQLH
jgi:hypothetical protein